MTETLDLRAHEITVLYQQIKINQSIVDHLDQEYGMYRDAYRFMNLILNALRDNVGLQAEWSIFLECAGISEPAWMGEPMTVSIE